MKHRGNHLPPVIISHPSAVLEAWEEATCSRQTDREKACHDSGAQKVSAISQDFGSAAAPLGTGSTRVSALCSVCQTSSYPHWTCHFEDVRAFKNPRASTFWVLKKSSRRMKHWVLRSCQDLWTLPERSSFVGNWGQSEVPQRRPSFYSRQTEKTKTLIKLLCPWSISFMNALAALQVHGGLAVLFRWISVFWISISPLRFALVSDPKIKFFFQWIGLKGSHFLKIQRLYALQPLKIHD